MKDNNGLPNGTRPVKDNGDTPAVPSLADLFFEFMLIGAVSFGGGVVAYERLLLVEKRNWLTSDQFMASLSISQTMPGLNSVNLAVLAGDHLRGVPGAVAAALGLVIPGATFVMIIAAAYRSGQEHPVINQMLAGVACGATGLLSAITWKLGGKLFRQATSLFIIIATFSLMSFAKFSLVKVLLIMAPVALFIYRPRP